MRRVDFHRGGIAIQLDEIDRKIIAELQADGRTSYVDLASTAGLSAAAVRPRVQRLIESGVVRVVGITDPTAMGYPVMAMLGIQVEGDTRSVANQLADLANVIYVVLTAGSFDLLVEVICTGTGDLVEVINDRIKVIPGVLRVESFMYLETHTHRFGWSVR